MQMGGVGQTSGKDMWVEETTTINQRIIWQRVQTINAKLPE